MLIALAQGQLSTVSLTFSVPSVTTLPNIVVIVVIIQEKRVLLAKEGEHGNVIYIVPPICINEEDVTEVIFIIMVTIIPFVSLML